MRTASKTGCLLQAEGDWERGPPAADGNQRVVALYLIDTCPPSPGASCISNPREGRGAGPPRAPRWPPIPPREAVSADLWAPMMEACATSLSLLGSPGGGVPNDSLSLLCDGQAKPGTLSHDRAPASPLPRLSQLLSTLLHSQMLSEPPRTPGLLGSRCRFFNRLVLAFGGQGPHRIYRKFSSSPGIVQGIHQLPHGPCPLVTEQPTCCRPPGRGELDAFLPIRFTLRLRGMQGEGTTRHCCL